MLETKKRTKVVNSQIAIIVEDGQIRSFKIVTLIVQLCLEILSLIALVWLQMQRHNVSSILLVGERFWDVLFRIPEQYQCQLGKIRERTYFNRSWDDLGLSPSNNNGEK